jgi:hypothetical protein
MFTLPLIKGVGRLFWGRLVVDDDLADRLYFDARHVKAGCTGSFDRAHDVGLFEL